MQPKARFITAALAAGVALASAGCGWPYTSSGSGGGGNAGTGGAVAPQGDPPILDALNMVQSAQATGGFYTITGYITFHTDDSYVVTTVLVDVPVIGKTITVPEPSLATAYGLYFSFQLPDQVPLSGAGATTYIVTLVTNGGAQSTPADESVVLL